MAGILQEQLGSKQYLKYAIIGALCHLVFEF